MKPKLRIFSNLARTGGTLVSRCLACMEGKALVSEIHPLGTKINNNGFNILKQIQAWYQLCDPADLGDGNYNFREITMLIARTMEQKGLDFIIRDWAHLDYMAVPFLEAPCYRSRLVELLEQDFNIVQYHLVRHPVPQWLSTNHLKIISGKLGLEQYLKGCFHYAELCLKNGFAQYEAFCDQPEATMKQICENLQLEYDPTFMKKWPDYVNVTGHIFKENPIRDIRPAVLPKVNANLYQRLHACGYYEKTLTLLGYDDVEVK